MIMMALGEDLEKSLSRCANRYCQKLKPKNAKRHGWERRSIFGRKEWLCDACSAAYTAKQCCEFCLQIYIENTAEFSDLDGKQWAQCEAQGKCGRWTHTECLAKAYKKTEAEVAAKSFKYICGNCKLKGKKKKPLDRSRKKGKVKRVRNVSTRLSVSN
eukprot:TRINITY_DN2403_c0_g1_i1.p2 TRINITY_DN2403_c0_g1~~TRINITY_DN2403_c0_g1_i1.p2  ORF type:complete len:158 (+),score=33.04 TRINITY_DN2403_c0_g1_i1:566-1039(+)